MCNAWKSGLVQFFGPKFKDQDQGQSAFIPEPKKTGPECKKPKTAVLDQVYTGLNWFKTGFSANILKLWIGKFIDILLTFKTSPRTLIYIKNWHSYENILVHLVFLIEFYSFYHIFVNFGPINLFLDAFWRVYIGLQKTGPNRSDRFI